MGHPPRVTRSSFPITRRHEQTPILEMVTTLRHPSGGINSEEPPTPLTTATVHNPKLHEGIKHLLSVFSGTKNWFIHVAGAIDCYLLSRVPCQRSVSADTITGATNLLNDNALPSASALTTRFNENILLLFFVEVKPFISGFTQSTIHIL